MTFILSTYSKIFQNLSALCSYFFLISFSSTSKTKQFARTTVIVKKISFKLLNFSNMETKLLAKQNKKLVCRIQLFVLNYDCDDNNHKFRAKKKYTVESCKNVMRHPAGLYRNLIFYWSFLWAHLHSTWKLKRNGM